MRSTATENPHEDRARASKAARLALAVMKLYRDLGTTNPDQVANALERLTDDAWIAIAKTCQTRAPSHATRDAVIALIRESATWEIDLEAAR